MGRRGRQKSFTITDYDELRKLAAIMTMPQIAAFYGVCEDTLFNSTKKDKEAAAALQQGRAEAVAYVGGKLFDLISKGDRAAIFFYLKTRGGYREVSRHEVAYEDSAFPSSETKEYRVKFIRSRTDRELPALEGVEDEV